jgi:mono/diheme cytochrome c family protein
MKKKSLFYLIFIIFFSLLLPVKSDSVFDLGKDVFLNKAMCSTCHTLLDAGSEGQIGPNLNEIRPDKMRVMNTVTNGIGVMPAYEGQLTAEEIEAVAHYVSTSSAN